MIKKEAKYYYSVWVVTLAAAIYCTSVHVTFFFSYLLLFIVCLVAGVVFDFVVCEWQPVAGGPNDESNVKEEGGLAFMETITSKYEQFDPGWKNFGLYGVLLIFGIILFWLMGWLAGFWLKEQVNWWNSMAMSAVMIPYFFHRAFYYYRRIPGLKKNVYLYETADEDCRQLVAELNALQERVSREKVVDPCRLVLLDNSVVYNDKSFRIVAIPRTWSYRQLLDFIFFQNSQPGTDSYYRSHWDAIPLHTGGDGLVKTCWTVGMKKGTWANNTYSAELISDFSRKEFQDKAMEEYLFFSFTRVI